MPTRYRSYAPPVAGSPQVAPSPADATSPPPAPSPRYAYLAARLRGRQITMEEATELFQIQQRMIQGMLPSPGAPPPPQRTVSAAPTGGTAPALGIQLSDDSLGVGLVALGAAAGLLAALLRRSDELRRSPSSLPRTPSP
ncbi:MAG: hypothetical protein L3K13_06375 [Thermoplasmata archaeon]|nr:hypothetical protein [Thermoplasmata archaeon]